MYKRTAIAKMYTTVTTETQIQRRKSILVTAKVKCIIAITYSKLLK